MDENEVYKQALEKFGLKAQLLVAAEECSELTLALLKFVNRGGPAEDVIEETADVLNMVKQIELSFGKDNIEKVRLEKLERIWKKILTYE